MRKDFQLSVLSYLDTLNIFQKVKTDSVQCLGADAHCRSLRQLQTSCTAEETDLSSATAANYSIITKKRFDCWESTIADHHGKRLSDLVPKSPLYRFQTIPKIALIRGQVLLLP